MQCPYCGEEMEQGVIQCRDGVYWRKKKGLVAAVSGLSKDALDLAHSQARPFSGAAAIAYHCQSCKKIVMDYTQETDANEVRRSDR